MSVLDELFEPAETFEEAAQLAPVIPEQQQVAIAGGALGLAPPVTQPASLEVQPAEEGAGFTTAFKTGFVSDPQTKLRILATDRFPDLEQDQALQRFGFVDGNPVFVNEQGQLEAATGGMADLMGSIAAESPEIAGAIAGTFTPMPVLGSALGAAGGEAIKRVLANVFLEEPQTVGGNILAVSGEAALDLTFGGLAKSATGLVNKRAIAAGEKQINPAALAEARDNITKATGIELDIAQVSGIPELIQLKRWASKFPGDAAAIIQANDDLIAGQVETAVARLINVMAAGNPTLKSGIRTINAAKAALTAAKTERNAAVSPLYKKAFAEPGVTVDTSATLALIDQSLQSAKGPIRAILKQTRDLFNRAEPFTAQVRANQARIKKLQKGLTATEAAENVGPRATQIKALQADIDRLMLDDTVQGLHKTRRAIDLAIETKNAGGKLLDAEMTAELVTIRNSLTKELTDASPLYRQASDEFAKLSTRLVDPLLNSPIGVLAKLEDKNAGQAAAKIFSGASVDPVTVRIAREAILKAERANPELAGAWNGAVSQWLQGNFVRAAKETQTGQAVNVAGKFRQAVIGTKVQKAAMKEALGPQAVNQFNQIMDALQMVARTPLGASETAFFQLISRKLDAGTFSMLQSIFSPRKTLLDTQSQRFMESLSKSIANGLTDPAKVQELNRLFKLKPGTERSVLITSLALGQIGAFGVAGELGVDQTPPLLQQIGQQSGRSVLDELGTL